MYGGGVEIPHPCGVHRAATPPVQNLAQSAANCRHCPVLEAAYRLWPARLRAGT
jgi:hypothetical protein